MIKVIRDDIEKGGPGSGNHGHKGRPGEIGGSGKGGGHAAVGVTPDMDANAKANHLSDYAEYKASTKAKSPAKVKVTRGAKEAPKMTHAERAKAIVSASKVGQLPAEAQGQHGLKLGDYQEIVQRRTEQILDIIDSSIKRHIENGGNLDSFLPFVDKGIKDAVRSDWKNKGGFALGIRGDYTTPEKETHDITIEDKNLDDISSSLQSHARARWKEISESPDAPAPKAKEPLAPKPAKDFTNGKKTVGNYHMFTPANGKPYLRHDERPEGDAQHKNDIAADVPAHMRQYIEEQDTKLKSKLDELEGQQKELRSQGKEGEADKLWQHQEYVAQSEAGNIARRARSLDSWIKEGKRMKSKYASRSALTGKEIKPGDEIIWHPSRDVGTALASEVDKYK